jgi:hypothetical protein
VTPTLKPRRCKHCREKFLPERLGQLVHVECIGGYMGGLIAKRQAKQEAARRAAAKVERVETKRRKAALETIPELIKLAQRIFNAYIRERDKDKPCICCGNPLGASSGSTGGAFDCGHYRSVGSASHLRYDERNAHGQRKQCNRYGAGRAVDYRIGLIARIGLPAVQDLENDNTPHKWERDELREIAKTYRAKLKALLQEKETA